VIEREVVHARNISPWVTGLSIGELTLHLPFLGLWFMRFPTNTGGLAFLGPCPPPHARARAHTRTRTHAHYVRTCASRALCARQLDTFGRISESEFVDGDRAEDKQGAL
jgi:hypothetical protein